MGNESSESSDSPAVCLIHTTKVESTPDLNLKEIRTRLVRPTFVAHFLSEKNAKFM